MTQRVLRLALVFVVLATLGVVGSAAVGYAAGTSSGGPGLTTISIQPQAQLVTTQFGPGANVSVSYSCFPSPAGGKGGDFIEVKLTDLHGNSGFGRTGATCDDTMHTATVFVQSFNGTFVAGDAAANATVCGDLNCASTAREVKLS